MRLARQGTVGAISGRLFHILIEFSLLVAGGGGGDGIGFWALRPIVRWDSLE